MRFSSLLMVPLALLALDVVGVSAQAATPTTQPALLTIYMENLKLGHEVAAERTSSEWPKLFEEAGHPDIYLAMASISGPPMVWYVQPFDSYAAEGRAMMAIEGDPALSTRLTNLWQEHTTHLESARLVQLVARPELSGGDFPDLNQQRFWDITIFRIRSGHDGQFAEAAQTYGEIASRAAPDLSYRVYQVVTGMPGGTYLIFSSTNEYGGFDGMMANDAAVWEAMSDDEREMFDAFAREALQSSITNRFRLSPTMSFVNDEMKAADPDFWNQ